MPLTDYVSGRHPSLVANFRSITVYPPAMQGRRDSWFTHTTLDPCLAPLFRFSPRLRLILGVVIRVIREFPEPVIDILGTQISHLFFLG
jgi:hypothetical protein